MFEGAFRSYFGAICVPILDKGDGTISNVTHDWANAAATLSGGLAVTVMRLQIRNFRVDLAKERLAEMAVANHCQWAFFLDDDVICPPETLMKMTRLWKSDPKYKVISGVYWSKSDPPVPLIFKGTLEGSFWDWTIQDLITADGAGAGCHPAGTGIITNLGVKNIEDIQINDLVLTHTGQFKKITNVFERDYKGHMFTVIPWKQSIPVRLTEEHPILVKRNNKFEWVKVKDLRQSDLLVLPRIKQKQLKETIIKISTFLNDSSIKIDGDYIYSRYTNNKEKRIKNNIVLDGDFWKLVGYWLAEGWATIRKNGGAQLGFAFHSDEKDYIAEIVSLMLTKFGLKGKVRKRDRHTTEIDYYGKPLVQFFMKLFGCTSYGKKLPVEFILAEMNLQRNLICGLFRGDGCLGKEFGGTKRIYYSTRSKILAYQIRDILIKNKVACGLRVDQAEKSLKYIISLYGKTAEKMNNYLSLGKFLPRFRKHKEMIEFDDNYGYLPIRQIKKQKSEEKVFNLEVEEDNSFMTDSFVVHNCLFVDTKVFEQLPKPWFCNNYFFEDPRSEYDMRKWQLTDMLGAELAKGKDSNPELIKKYEDELKELAEKLKETLAGGFDPNLLKNKHGDANTTEDLYFFKKVKEKLGLDLWIDCSLQCQHQDKTTGRFWGLTSDMPQNQPRYAKNMKPGDKIVLDLGCGDTNYYVEDGKPIRVDIDPKVKPDVIADARFLSCFEDCFADIIIASHLLEHFTFKEVMPTLKEWVRILKIGGKLCIIIPNLRWASKRILEPPKDQEEAKRTMFMYYSAQKGDLKEAHLDTHKSGFTPDSLRDTLKRIGDLDEIEIYTSEGNYSNWKQFINKTMDGYNVIAFAKKVKHSTAISLKVPFSVQEEAMKNIGEKTKLEKSKLNKKIKKNVN